MISNGKNCSSETECACKSCRGNQALYEDGWCDGCLIDCVEDYLPISVSDCGLGYQEEQDIVKPQQV